MGRVDTYPSPSVGFGPSGITLGYAQVVNTQSTTNTVAPGDNLTGLVVTVTVPAGRRLRITGYGFFTSTAAAAARFVILDETNAFLSDSGADMSTTAAQAVTATAIVSPTAGTHTYRLAFRTNTGTLTFGGYSTIPGFILVEDITGPSVPSISQPVPVGQLAYSVGSFTNGTTYTTAQTPAGMSVNVVVPAGRVLKITAFLWQAWSLTNAVIQHRIQEDGVNIATFGDFSNNTGHGFSAYAIVQRSPSAGAHTYSVLVEPNATAGTVTLYNGAANIPYIMVEDITPTPPQTTGASSSILAYTENFASGQTFTNSTIDLTGGAVTVTVPEGRRLRIRGKAHISSGIANDRAILSIREGTTILNDTYYIAKVATIGEDVYVEAVVSPSAGTHTYKLSAVRQSGSGTWSIYSVPGDSITYLSVEDITGTSLPPGYAPTAESGQTLGYIEQKAVIDQVVTAGAALTGLSVTVNVPAGRRLRVTQRSNYFSTVTDDSVQVHILQDGVTVDRAYNNRLSGASEQYNQFSVITSPAAGTHTYTVYAVRNGGTGVITSRTGPTQGSFLHVEDVTGYTTTVPAVNVPVGVLAYTEMTADITGVTTGTGVIGSLNISVPAGRTLRIGGEVTVQSTVADDQILLNIRQDGTLIRYREVRPRISGVGESYEVEAIISPSAGAHTYQFDFSRGFNATGTLSAAGSATRIGHFVIEDITPTPAASTGAPSSTLAYAEVTSGQTGITTVTDLTGLAATVTVPAGRRLRISAKAAVNGSVASNTAALQIQEGATVLQNIQIQNSTTAGNGTTQTGDVIVTPSAGTHTYKLTLQLSAGSGTVGMAAAATFPAYILIEDITGSVYPASSTITAGLIASEPWIDFVPIMSQVGNVTFNVNSSRYTRHGRLIIWNAALTVTGTGTAGTGLSLTLPVPSAVTSPGPSFGAGSVYDTSAATFYNGSWVPASTTTIVLVGDWSGPQVWGNTPSIAAGNGDFIRVSIMYEAAS